MTLGILVMDLVENMGENLNTPSGQFFYAYGCPIVQRGSDDELYAHPSELRSQEVGIRRVSELLDFGSSNGIPIYGTQLRSDLAGIPYYPLRKEFAKYVTSGRMINKDHEDSFQDTELHKILQQDGVTDLVVVGYNLNACVIQTVRTALELGYWVIVSPHHLFWNRYSVFEDTLEELRTTSDYYETANLLLEHLKTILIKD